MIPYSTQLIDEDDIKAVIDTLKSSHLTQGKQIESFEKAICKYIGVKNAVVFNSATSALFSLYNSLEIGVNDEVITTPISFVATSNMFVTLGAKPVWCDIKLDGNIDESFIEKLITPKTKAIVAVDFGGKPVEHLKIKEIAKKYDLFYIDDASHAFGSELNRQKVGTFADATIFSFHAIKPFTTGEGGCVVTDDDKLAKKLRLFCSHGIVKKELYKSDMIQMGYNFRLTDFQAALGLSQLKKVDSFIKKRNEIADYYDKIFEGNEFFTTQNIESYQKSSRHLYPILLNDKYISKKDEIFKKLHSKGIGVQVHYRPIYQNSFYQKNFGKIALKSADKFYDSEISIPCHQKMSLDDARFVADILLKTIENIDKRLYIS